MGPKDKDKDRDDWDKDHDRSRERVDYYDSQGGVHATSLGARQANAINEDTKGEKDCQNGNWRESDDDSQ